MSVSTSSFCAVTTTGSIVAVGAGGGPSAARTTGQAAMTQVYRPSHIAQGAGRIRWTQPLRRFKTSSLHARNFDEVSRWHYKYHGKSHKGNPPDWTRESRKINVLDRVAREKMKWP